MNLGADSQALVMELGTLCLGLLRATMATSPPLMISDITFGSFAFVLPLDSFFTHFYSFQLNPVRMFFIIKPDQRLQKILDHQSRTIDLPGIGNDKLPGLKQASGNLVRIMALLPGQYRQVFFMKVVQGMSVYDISIRQRCTMLEVYRDLHKVIRHIRQNIESYRFMVTLSKE